MAEEFNKDTQQIDRHVGQKVRLRRTLMNMSQEKLGDALGVTFQQIQKYERGVNRIGAGRLFYISSILQVPVSFFYEGLGQSASGAFGDNDQTPYVNDLLSSNEGIQLAAAFSRLQSSDVRRRFIELLKAVAEQDERSAVNP
jgi:transcriptional regulator with XRE-family HTH domain